MRNKVRFQNAKNQASEEGSQSSQGQSGTLARTCRIPSTRRSSKARGGSRANGAFGTRRSGPQSDSTDCGPPYINGSGVFGRKSDNPPLIGPHLLSPAGFDPASARKRITAFLLSFALVTLAGCGGGDGNVRPDTMQPPPQAELEPEPTPEPEPTIQRSRFDPVNGLEVDEAFMDGYLAAIEGPVDYHDGPQRLNHWSRPPVVKYAPSLARYSPVAVEYLRFAVAELNDALPPEMEVKWGGAWNAPLDSLSEEHFEGLIVIGIGDVSEILSVPPGTALGVAIPIPSNRATLDGGVIVGVDPATTRLARQSDYEVFVHEMIHAMGLLGHVPSGRYGPDELMDNRARLIRSVKEHHYLSLVHHYDPNYLGGWNGDYEFLRGDTGDVGYEVWLMNDALAWPIYGFGDRDWTQAHPRELGGSASWRGGLVGYTSGQRFVEGTSALDYDFGADRLSANFTWDGGGVANYRRVETGALGTFYAEDARGAMHGLFLGDDHEYASGSLDRTDITAAFGAERQ